MTVWFPIECPHCHSVDIIKMESLLRKINAISARMMIVPIPLSSWIVPMLDALELLNNKL
jgi:hypothetical protein